MATLISTSEDGERVLRLASGSHALADGSGRVVTIWDEDERREAEAEMLWERQAEHAALVHAERQAERGSWFGYGE